MRTLALAALLALLALVTLVDVSAPAQAEVRFGRNVRIGGHDVSGQTFSHKRRGRFYLYDRTPKNAGCRWTRARDGARVKVCHWRSLRR